MIVRVPDRPWSHDPTMPAAAGDQPSRVTLPGGYELVARVGSGGMGDVWRAWDPRLEREVAIKLSVSMEERVVGRLVREAKALARVRHPAIVTVFDIGRDERGLPFLVMELLEGEDLGSRLEREGALGQGKAVELLMPILEGLQIAHQNGVIHRDIKPENIFLTRRSDGGLQPTLVDFGIARTDALRTDLTVGLVGTPAFMAPEQLRSGLPVGPAVDQWGLAVTLYLVASGKLPFGSDNISDLFGRIQHAPLPFPRDGSVDARLFKLLARATRKEPADRYPDMAAFAADLREWRATRPAHQPLDRSGSRAAFESSPTMAKPAEPPASTADAPLPTATAEPVRQGARPHTLDEAIRRRFGSDS